MITDNKNQNGIPNAAKFVRNRVQMTKPVQMTESGSTLPRKPQVRQIDPELQQQLLAAQLQAAQPEPAVYPGVVPEGLNGLYNPIVPNTNRLYNPVVPNMNGAVSMPTYPINGNYSR